VAIPGVRKSCMPGQAKIGRQTPNCGAAMGQSFRKPGTL
jgi:hypothetical protein